MHTALFLTFCTYWWEVIGVSLMTNPLPLDFLETALKLHTEVEWVSMLKIKQKQLKLLLLHLSELHGQLTIVQQKSNINAQAEEWSFCWWKRELGVSEHVRKVVIFGYPCWCLYMWSRCICEKKRKEKKTTAATTRSFYTASSDLYSTFMLTF